MNIITDGYEDIDAINPRWISGEPAWDIRKAGKLLLLMLQRVASILG